ncbi:hypothetical protein GXB85_06160 [Cellulomonas sp. APG4]|uniref:hypothetical protein n=1 Tax=Cellulomonas sp. APG4 TaxID=1538656 RepID=UPI0013795708|nr:hypothetical protein [Cellulomonas sp. APG4]NCT90528.1 hypothetical protein [Cellulomonas sp. APG4]
MSTLTADHARPRTGSTRPVREVFRWIRETPAPGLESPAPRSRVAGYVAGSMALWTAIGVGGAVLVVRALELIPPVLG